MSDNDIDLKGYVATLPQRPGVYRMYAADGELLYVGKAARLRDRVGSYFSNHDLSPKVVAMVRRIARVEVTVVNSEQEALLLECNLIKAHRPRYNIMLRDDKSFPYILCSAGHEFPRLVFYRGPRQPNSRQYGPFASAHAVKEVLQHLQKVFKIRNCRDSFFANRSRPCLQHQIGRCSAPCVGLIGREEYAHDLEGAIGVLEGRNAEVIGELQRRMEAAAGQLKFEDAARLRDQLRELQEIRSQQIANAQRRADTDVIAIVGEPGQYAICVLPVREGQNLGSASHFPGSALSDPADTLADFLLLYYSQEAAPPEILINVALPDHEPVAQALQRAAGRSLELRVPQRGLKRQWLELALDNARNALRMRVLRAELALEGMQLLARVLDLPKPPERVECFDVSHTAGEGTVASCVVFTTEGARKREYRRYNIEGVTPGDDYGAMYQALLRHGARIASGERPRPDLLLIDGGPGQVDAALSALTEAGCQGLAVVGVAKGADRRPGQERLFRAGEPIPIVLEADSAALHFIQRVRDEAHRFAITGHRRRRARRYRESILETVPGLGPARRRAILTHFGGLQGVMRAGAADLEKVAGVGAAMARSIYDHLHPGA
ncbi:MAG TPA: excinuclease ABC subunit UvrC [Steroidobacteraceae bacterium]|jgi:excinuclease ABC subunit C|nr:excinuclease ABC subunit UvrC [Steroidobacteraceae bacterium]